MKKISRLFVEIAKKENEIHDLSCCTSEVLSVEATGKVRGTFVIVTTLFIVFFRNG